MTELTAHVNGSPISSAAEGGWAGTVGGVRVRTLAAGGDRLDALMVWSEVFARCDAPPVAVRWSGFRATTAQGRVVALYVPHVVERTRHLHRELGEALSLADVAIVTDFVGRRDALRDDVSPRMVLDDVSDPVRRLWAPTLDDAVGLALAVLRPGDLVVTLGVGEPWRAARAIVQGLRDFVVEA